MKSPAMTHVSTWVMRLFILALFTLAGCQSAPPVAPAPPAPLSILQGATDSTSTVLSIVVPKTSAYDFHLRFDGTELKAPALQVESRDHSEFKALTLVLKGLRPDSRYSLIVTDESGAPIDERTFKTYPTQMLQPQIAVISCTSDRYVDLQREQWREVWRQAPDALFLIGDNVYIDEGKLRGTTITDKEIWRRYVEARLALEIYRMKELIPVFATWDDHDYGHNDADSRFAYKAQAKAIFNTFFPMHQNTFVNRGPGVASALSFGQQTFVFFDDRSFRSPKKITPGDTHFGGEQEKWFLGLLKKKKGPFWLISGDQFFGGYHPFESYEGHHPDSFKTFLKNIKASQRTVIFVSGDRHVAEIMKIPKERLGYETYEFTSSGLHAHMYPGSLAKTPNPLAIYGKDGTPHYILFQSQATGSNRLKLKTKVLGEKSQVLFEEIFEVAR